MNFKVGDKVVIFDTSLAGIAGDFTNRIVVLKKQIDDNTFIINSEDFLQPGSSKKWNKGGWVRITGIRKASKLEQIL